MDLKKQLGKLLCCLKKTFIPKANFLCRLLPPRLTNEFVKAFDKLIENSIDTLLHLNPGTTVENLNTIQQLHLPIRLGGLLVFLSMEKSSTFAYFSSITTCNAMQSRNF